MKIPRSNIAGLLSAIALITITGCAKYHTKPLPEVFDVNAATATHVSPVTTTGTKTVTGYAYELSTQECKHIFSRNAPRKGLRAIHLSIKNDTKTNYLLRGSNLDIPMVSRYVVGDMLEIDVLHRVLGWTVPGLFFWLLLIPAIVEGFGATSANRKMMHDLDQRIVDDHTNVVIKPGSVLSRVIFMRHDSFEVAGDTMHMTLEDIDSTDKRQLSVTIDK